MTADAWTRRPWSRDAAAALLTPAPIADAIPGSRAESDGDARARALTDALANVLPRPRRSGRDA